MDIPTGYAPGPWSWDGEWSVFDADGERVCEILTDADRYKTPADSPEDSAHARLIALAPAMADAIRERDATIAEQAAKIAALTTDRDNWRTMAEHEKKKALSLGYDCAARDEEIETLRARLVVNDEMLERAIEVQDAAYVWEPATTDFSSKEFSRRIMRAALEAALQEPQS